MISKIKLIGLLATFILVGCQQNAPIQNVAIQNDPMQKTDNASVVNSQSTPKNTTSISRLAIIHPTKEQLPKNDGNIVVATCPVAALHGKLKIKGEVLIIEVGGNTDVQPIFSENNVSWNEATKTLTYLGKAYKEGDEVHWGGGYGLPNETEFRKSPNVSIPDNPNTTLFYVCP